MIRLVDNPAAGERLLSLAAQGCPAQGCLIASYYRGMREIGVPLEDLAFWLCEGEGSGAAVLMRLDGIFILCGEAPDIEELGEFLHFFRGGQAYMAAPKDRKLLTRLPLENSREERLLQFGRAPSIEEKVLPADERAPRPVSEGLRAVYQLIREHYGNDFSGQDEEYERWLSGIRYRQRGQGAQVYAIYEGQEPVSAASLSGTAGEYALIGSVVTRTDRREKGLGSHLVRHLCSKVRDAGRVPVLCCDEELVPFYQRLGFDESGRCIRAHIR